jgi:hypothetical protein
MFFDALQAEFHNKYDLRPIPIGLRNNTMFVPKKTHVSQPKDKEKEVMIVTQKIESS